MASIFYSSPVWIILEMQGLPSWTIFFFFFNLKVLTPKPDLVLYLKNNGCYQQNISILTFYKQNPFIPAKMDLVTLYLLSNYINHLSIINNSAKVS